MFMYKGFIRHIELSIVMLWGVLYLIHSSTSLFAQVTIRSECQASFSYYYDSLNFLGVYFVDESTGSFGWWNWDFGDGWGSSEQNPYHAYSQPGQYSVCLTISSESKVCYDVECKNVKVPKPSNCNSTFSWIADSANPFSIQFVCHPGEDADSFFWSFGDGDTSSLSNPFHVYADTGTFIVTLSASNRHNPIWCQSIYSDTVKIEIEPCVSSFIAYPSSINPFEVEFIPTATGNIDHYYWDFGDGRTSMEPHPIYTYLDTGIFTVCLTVWNGNYINFCNDISCQNIKIHFSKCEANYTWQQDSIHPLKFKFINQSYGLLNDFLWDFGDGDTSHQINPLHAFPMPGDYQVKLKVKNIMHPEFCMDSIEKTVPTGSLNCMADFSWTTDSLRPLDIAFTSNISGSPNYILWDFGDGSTDTILHPIHTFPDTGYYNVSLIVSNSFYPEYCSDTSSQQIHILLHHQPKADFSYIFDSISLVPNLFHFFEHSKGNQIQSWYWTFGDGTSSTLPNPDHVFPQVQNFYVCLKITDFLPPKYYLTDQCCKTISTYEYFNLGGSVYDRNLPINNPHPKGDTALVTLYKIYPGHVLMPWRSGTFYNLGYYWFTSVLKGEYLIKARLSSYSMQSDKFFPTWALQSLIWSTANPVLLNKNIFNADVHLIPKPYIEPGAGSINGRIIVTSDPSLPAGDPAINTCVFLLNSNNEFLDFTFSDSLGQFYFDKLPWGIYILIPEAIGMFYTEDSAVIDAQHPQADDVLLKIWSTGGLSVNSIESKPSINIWPNPASDYIKIELQLPTSGTVKVELISATGHILKTHQREVTASHYQFTMSLKGLPQGIYLLKITSSTQNYTLKVLKK
ncbi:MAG TPA: PKD domain-containing protein [Bacteroidales bacterium]|nr:PKD domain-containing protein [Bacteroidales bacterium]